MTYDPEPGIFLAANESWDHSCHIQCRRWAAFVPLHRWKQLRLAGLRVFPHTGEQPHPQDKNGNRGHPLPPQAGETKGTRLS